MTCHSHNLVNKSIDREVIKHKIPKTCKQEIWPSRKPPIFRQNSRFLLLFSTSCATRAHN